MRQWIIDGALLWSTQLILSDDALDDTADTSRDSSCCKGTFQRRKGSDSAKDAICDGDRHDELSRRSTWSEELLHHITSLAVDQVATSIPSFLHEVQIIGEVGCRPYSEMGLGMQLAQVEAEIGLAGAGDTRALLSAFRPR